MKNILILLFLTFFYLNTNAQTDFNSVSARAWGMGNASITLSDAFSSFYNQANLAELKELSLGVYADNRFNVEGFGTQAFALNVPTKFGAIAGNFRNFGFDSYRDQKFGLAYGRSLGKKVNFGLQLDYFRNSINNQILNALTFETGLLIKLNENLNLGIHLFNPIPKKNDTNLGLVLPTMLKIGIGYQLSDKVLITTEIEKDIDFKPIVKVGIEYQIIEMLYARAGFSTNPQISSLGLSYKIKSFSIDFAGSVHSILGFSPHVALRWRNK